MTRYPSLERKEDLSRMNGQRVIAHGRYRAVARPVKGGTPGGRVRDHAVIELRDGTLVYLEPLDDPRSVRPQSERDRFDGANVRVSGIAHAVMPSRGQSLIDPCLSDVTGVEEDR